MTEDMNDQMKDELKKLLYDKLDVKLAADT